MSGTASRGEWGRVRSIYFECRIRIFWGKSSALFALGVRATLRAAESAHYLHQSLRR